MESHLADQQLLAVLKKKLLVSELPQGVEPAVLASLEERSLVRRTTKGRRKELAYEITSEGKAWLKAQAPKPTRKPPATKPPPVTLADLSAMEARLNARFDDLMSRLGSPLPRADINSAIPAAIEEANKSGAHGGLVPIPEVRKLVLERTRVSRAQFDEVMLDLERRFAVDLKIADDPRRPDAAEGIPVPGRGLVYFVLAR